MIRALIDANVLAPGLTTSRTDPGKVLDAWMNNRFELIVSEPILNEVRRTLNKPYFRDRFPIIESQRVASRRSRDAIVVPISVQVHRVAAHSADDLVIATAVSGQTDMLVTGDRQLLRLGQYEEVRILSPRTFLDLLEDSPY